LSYAGRLTAPSERLGLLEAATCSLVQTPDPLVRTGEEACAAGSAADGVKPLSILLEKILAIALSGG
jgi:hypothetical protein